VGGLLTLSYRFSAVCIRHGGRPRFLSFCAAILGGSEEPAWVHSLFWIDAVIMRLKAEMIGKLQKSICGVFSRS
jgi:hypothetical protein